MSSEAEKLTRWRSLRAIRGVALVLLILAALFATAQMAEAAGTPKQLIIFTDKKVYTDWVFSQDKRGTNPPNVIEGATQYDLAFYVYAVVLDDDGNIMKGRTSYLSGTINDIAQLDHYDKGSAATHHSNVSDPNLISGTLTFRDDGTVTGDAAGDGIYTAVYNPTDFADAWSGSNVAGDDHYKINVTVSDSNMGKTVYTYVLLSGIRCHQGYTHGSTHMDGIMPGGVDNCAVCHPGYEHFYESISGTIPASMQDIHSTKVQEPSVISDDKGFGDFVWNTSYTQASSMTGVDWKTYWPGSGYCPFCHTNSAGTVLDYSGGDRTPAPLSRPSCGETSSYYGSCHASTEMAGTPVADWLPAAGTMVNRQNYNISLAKSHNHTSNKANVSCAICHSGSHALNMPNMSADISSSGNLNDQCVLCHNITGGLNITANGGRNENHTNPNCKACHIDQSVKMDSHLVPTAGIPNANCTECHDLGGISPNHIDFGVFNRSDYVHNQYNESTGMRPLNYNGSNGSALRPSENKICWGCHGDDPNNDGKANYSEQPENNHPARYRNARLCEECHQNASSPWRAPQNVAHSYNTIEVRTPGAPNCYDCHGQPVMFNNSHKDADFNETNVKGVKASVANHYGTGFPPLAKSRGSNGYCIKYCHQNSSSPFFLEFYNKDNMQRPNHSAMASRPQNQSCRDEQCHAADAIHDEKMRKPTLAGGTFGNGNCTAPGCHSPSDSGGFNYSNHNNVVNCTSCHMDNIGANIHPIKYLQNDGTDFAQVNLTAASCKLCHKNSQGDAVMNRWGVTPRKVGSQHHSSDPENGSKWNKTIQPYWDYLPNQITFVSGWVKNSYRGFITNFEAMQDTNSSAGTISENVTEDVLVGHYPSNNDFNITVQSGGWYANGTATTRSWSNLPADGNPNGSLIVASTTKNQVVDAVWTASFVYNKTAKVADASIKLDSKLIKAKNINTATLKAINVTIEDNYGNTTEVFNRSLPDVPEIDWSIDEKTIPNPDGVFWKNASLDHTYNVTLRTRWTGLGGSLVPDIKVGYDNVFVNLSEVDYKKYNFTFFINDTPPSDRYNLIVGYQTHVEKARLYVLNGSSFKYRTDLDNGAFTKVILPLSKEEYGSGNVTLRINDSNGPGESPADVNEIDVKPDYIDIDYMFIDSYRWINNSRVNYPCEYCHAPNKHSQHALGIPTAFMGNNSVGQNVNSSTTWCASCHYQGYVSGSNTYADMIQAFLDHMLPVPPEITGHSIYGVNNTQSPDYYEHSGLSRYDDSICWNCHKGNLADGSTSTQFLHNVSLGTAGGGRNCTACHGPGGGATGMLVNFTSVGKGMHASLNKNASSTLQNASNKPCWGCHGTMNGTWANESDQPLNDHNTTFKGSARTCFDCHSDSLPLYGAKNVTDHIPSGLSGLTDVNTSKYNMTSCAYCHNNSIVAAYDPDDLGRNPLNASASHYGANRTANKLMAPGINSNDCVFCHRNTTNMLKWGILPGSLANINNKNASGGGTDHSSYTASSQCPACHGGYVVTQGFTFHNGALGNGAGGGGGSNCTACHNIGGSKNNVNFTAINKSMHGTLNSKATSLPQNVPNKPCWGCHGTLNGTYANESDQPASSHNITVYKSPRKCFDCHITGSLKLTMKNVTDHIQQGSTALTDVKTSSYCSYCHNNSVNFGYEPDAMGVGGIDPMNASVSHYGSKSSLIETIGDIVSSQGCTYCHYDPNNSAKWGSATDPRTSIVRPHIETQNSQCWGCHILGVSLPSTFHEQSLLTGGGTGTAPPVPLQSPRILVATNRYVILDDWRTGGATGPGFSNPVGNHTTNSFTGNNTRINATALFIDDTGSPATGKTITFNLYMPNGTELTAARVNATTDGNGLANFAFDMDVKNYYGNWTVRASNGSLNDSTKFIYNWWGCGISSGCNSGHSSNNPTGTQPKNSPYLNGRESPSWSSHSGITGITCTSCHQSFDGRPGGLTYNDANHTSYANDVHRSLRCDNANCHQSITTHNTNANISSCYNQACHTPANRSDISNRSTKNVILSRYSSDNGSTIYSTFHTPNSTVPCIICHGPMHNISKPDETQLFIRNNITESGQCTACHLNTSHSRNRAVNCSMCHSPDAHAPKFITNLTTASVANYTASRASSAVCTDCHNNTGINSYLSARGYSPKKNDSYTYNLTKHNNVVSCTTCHDRLHWIGYMNSTGLYQPAAAGAIACLDCHSGTNANVSNTTAYWGYMTPAKSRHNNSVSCESCHSGSKHGIRFLQPDRVTFGSKLTPATCVNCHQQGYAGAPSIPAPLNHSTNPYSGALWNGTQSRFWDNTSQLSSCNFCHGAVIHSSSALGEISKVKGMNNLNQSLTNGYWCANCHYKNAPGYAGGQFSIQPPEVLNANGLVPGSARDGTAFFNHTDDLSAGYDDARCKSCHDNGLGASATSLNFTHNVGIGSSGGINCIACHDVSSPGTAPRVDFAAINASIHGSLNSQASSSPENTLNKPCWGCHGTKTGTYANESDQPPGGHDATFKSYPRKCEDCHINGSIQFSARVITEHIMPGKSPLTEINVTEGYCSVCHNNSITVNGDSDGIGIFSAINASAAHYSKDANINLMTATVHSNNCTYCHFINNGSDAWLTPKKPLTSTHSSLSNNTPPSDCWGCHVDFQGEPSTFHIQAINKGAGSGPNCRSCHNISDTSTNRGHIDIDVFNTSIHGNMNTTGGSDLNEPCWGCHGNGNSEGHNITGDASGKGMYRNPYNCSDCHISTGIRYSWASARNGLTVAEHYSGGADIRASYNAITIYSCLNCHQNISEMRLSNSDDDTNRTVWASGGDTYAAIGGNNSPYHYGRKRIDMRSGINASCSYCHQNLSSVFPLTDTNRSIREHTDTGGNITARACTNADCHAAGFIHNSSLTRPQVQSFTSGRYDYCAPCHKSSGISTKKVLGHNTTNISLIALDCGYCHNASSQGQVSVLRIHSPGLTNRSTSNATCAACHRDAKYVPASRIIKTHYPGATSDKGNTSESARTCEACHGEVGTNKLHQSMIKKPLYDCRSCHLDGFKTSPYNATTSRATIVNFQHDNSSHAPTNQTNCERCHNTTERAENFHFTEYANGTSVSPGWAGWINGTQVNCIDCHLNNTNKPPFFTQPLMSGHNNYSLDDCYICHSGSSSNRKALHWVDPSPANANCTFCHDIGGEAAREIDVQAMNRSDSIHLNLNKDAAVIKAAAPYAADSKRCWACHGNGTEPAGHPTNFKNAFKCVDCHVTYGTRNTNYTPNNTILIVTEHTKSGSDIRTPASSYCTDCHNKTEMLIQNNDTVLSLTNPANDSAAHSGRKRGDIRSGQNTSCSYCHQNISTAFENVMTNSLNKSILEHTSSTGANISNSTLTCTSGKCHAAGFIHNSTLTKPQIQVWTEGRNDYCAPCHRAGNYSATIYVYAHNTSNISVINTDCGYCHNASSQGIISGALRIHTRTLTNTSKTNSSCATCHRDSTYVGISRVINTHYPDAPPGKANTSRSSWDCEECHGWSSGAGMHSAGLVKKPNYDCNACHNSAGGSPYKAYATPFVNLTRHDNTSHNGANVNCNTCHNSTNRKEPFHFTVWSNGSVEAPGWAGWTNGTRANCIDCHITYASQAPFYAEPGTYPNWHKAIYGSALDDCYQCHSNLTILSASNSKAQVEMHNVTRSIAWNNCNSCHSNKYGGANRVDNTSLSSSMHAGINGAAINNIDPACRACHGGNNSVHRNSTANDCTYCHITGATKYGAKNVSEHIPNGIYSGTQVNTSRYQQVYCDLCHNNSIGIFIDDTPGSRNATSAHYGQNYSFAKLMNPGVNSSECMYCHRNTSNMEKWGISQVSKANITNRQDHSSFSSNVNCYDCHVDTRSMPQTFHAEDLNEGAGSSPNCLGCHDITGTYAKVDFSITNHSSNIHKNLNSAANSQGYDSANKPCWACHGNGTATVHINNTYKAPKLCENCHINSSRPFGAPQVREHFRNGSDIRAANATNNTRSCLACHQNISEMRLVNNDPDAGSFDADLDGVNGTGISAYHYGRKRPELRSGVNTSCIYCHQNITTAFENVMTNIISKSILEHTTDTWANISNSTLSCTGSKCHSSGLIHDTNLTKYTTQAWTPGGADFCAPCHKPGNSNATKYVYNQRHDPANSSGDRIGDCGFCHNASSQGMNGSTVRIHTPSLTNTTSYVLYGTCPGCHNSTSIFVGAPKQIFSHLPNGSQYRGNTSMSNYTCENCHNMITGASMHSAGMDRSNGTCITCHFNRISPFKAEVRIIETWDYNHTYAGQKTCNITQCHNAAGAALGFHLDKYAGAVVADPERINSIWGNRNNAGNGFTDTPYVDCIDCHREHNNTFPFNNTYPFDYSTNYSFNYEANHTGENKKIHSTSDSMDSCYNCHTDMPDIKNPQNRFKVHNVSIEPLLGGPACVSCHNKSAPTSTGYPPETKKVNHTAFNRSVHGKLVNFTLWNESKKQNSVLLDSACWTCHSTNLTELPNNAHPDRGGPASLRPFQCNECHTPEGNTSLIDQEIFQRTPKIYQHYAGKSFIGEKIFNSTKGCYECHENGLVPEINISYGEYARKGEANVSHYAMRDVLIKTNLTLRGCEKCHSFENVSGGLDGKEYGNAISILTTHNTMSITPVDCQKSCHNSNPAITITNHNINMGIYIGENACYASGCHIPPICEECTR